jgi:hypothetical protein
VDTHIHNGSTWSVAGTTQSVTTKTGRLVTLTGSTQSALDASLQAAISGVQPGDTILVRAGTYTAKYDPNGWNSSQFVLNLAQSGTSSQPVHLTAYPGETVAFTNSAAGNFYCGRLDATNACHYWNVSALNLTGLAENVYGGGITSDALHPKSGGSNWRFVGCHFHMTDTSTSNNVGQVEWEGDYWKVLGCTFTNDTSRLGNNGSGPTAYDNQAHSIYVDNGSSQAEIAYNRFIQRVEGYVFMTHQDGTAFVYTNNHIHHNYIEPFAPDKCRGFCSSNVDETSTLYIEDNWFNGAGDSVGGFGPLVVCRGNVYLNRNRFDNPRASMGLSNNYGGSCMLYIGTGANANTWNSSITMLSYDTNRSVANVTYV